MSWDCISVRSSIPLHKTLSSFVPQRSRRRIGDIVKIFVAGATGASGLLLVRALCTLGHEVTGMMRLNGASTALKAAGAEAVYFHTV